MRKMKRLFGITLMTMMLMSLFGGVSQVYAADPGCECYCAIDGTGATKFPDESTRVTTEGCYELCTKAGYSVAACAATPDQKPQYKVMCFEKEECTNQEGVFEVNGAKQVQPGECKQGMFYCYPDPASAATLPLQVKIGGYEVATDLGEYVSVLYKWLLGAGTTIAIVFLMIAGLRWSIGGLSAEQVGKAKTTILNAVMGLVLLMSTYLILYTVNPYLLRLKVPAFPMVKTVSLVGGESCGYLTGWWGDGSGGGHYPYTIKSGAPFDSPYATGGSEAGLGFELANYTEEKCGSIADVVKDGEGNAVTDDSTCTFDYCPTGELCYTTPGGGECLACGEVINGNPYIEPSTAVCSGLSLRTTFKGAGYKQISQCFWTDRGKLQEGWTGPGGSGTCAMLTIDCSQIKTCEDYDTSAKVLNNYKTISLEDIPFDGVAPVCVSAGQCVNAEMGDLSLKSVCNDDPCELYKREDMKGKGCWSVGLSTEAGFEHVIDAIIVGNDCNTVSL